MFANAILNGLIICGVCAVVAIGAVVALFRSIG